MVVKKVSLKDDTLGGTILCSTALSLLSRAKSSLVLDFMQTYLVPVLASLHLLPCLLTTSTARPDIVLVSEESVTMLEVTIPSNSKEAIIKAKERKTNKSNYNLVEI